MIPFVATVNVRGREDRMLRLWIPLFLLWVLLVPIGIVLAPFFLMGCLIFWVNPLQVVGTAWSIVAALRHTELAVDAPSIGISICVL